MKYLEKWLDAMAFALFLGGLFRLGWISVPEDAAVNFFIAVIFFLASVLVSVVRAVKDKSS